MFKLLNIPTTKSPHISLPSEWWSFKLYIKQNIDKAIAYYKSIGSFINSNHILIRYLSGLPVSIKLDDWDYYKAVKQIALNKSTAYGMTSSYGIGQIQHGNFYGDDKEIILAINGSHNPDWVNKNWELVRPITILKHDYDDLDYQLIRGVKRNSIGGISVILVDVCLLALQYRAFRNQEILKARLTNIEQKSIMFYMSAYPLNTALYSHIDQVILNRYRRMLNGEYSTIRGSSRVHFTTKNLDRKLTNMVEDSINKIQKGSRNVFDSLSSIPLNDHHDGSDWEILPETLKNRQCLWAYVYSKLSVIKTGLLLGGPYYKQRNSSWISNYNRLYNRILSDNITSVPNLRFVRKDLENEFKEINDLLN